MNCKNIWLTIEEVCSLTGDKFETIRRKCKSGKLETRFEKDGKFKKYFIQISSLSLELQEKHLNQLNEPKKLAVITSNIDESINKYSNAPCWAKKFVDKYLELFAATEKMNYKEKTEFLKDWNKKYPDKK